MIAQQLKPAAQKLAGSLTLEEAPASLEVCGNARAGRPLSISRGRTRDDVAVSAANSDFRRVPREDFLAEDDVRRGPRGTTARELVADRIQLVTAILSSGPGQTLHIVDEHGEIEELAAVAGRADHREVGRGGAKLGAVQGLEAQPAILSGMRAKASDSDALRRGLERACFRQCQFALSMDHAFAR